MKQREIDWRPPLSAFAPIAGEKGGVLLHGGDAARGADWSFVAADPALEIVSAGGVTTIGGEAAPMSPFEALSMLSAERRTSVDLECGAPLASGLIGFAGYECGRFVEPTAESRHSPYALPDFHFGAYDAVAAFDRRRRRAFLLGRARGAMERLEARLGEADDQRVHSDFSFRFEGSNFTPEDYKAAVAEAVERIRSGEFFQANLSQRFVAAAERPFDPYAFFSKASAASSAPYGAFIQCGAAQILSFSPERFFAVRPVRDGGFSIVAEPIKGTRPRGASPGEDARLLSELKSSPKDRAENIMIADLTRNDLSRVCRDGSIREEAICEAVTHANVHHLVSRISGVLDAGVSAADALAALFPCGSITGAPKVQAMTAIAQIEASGRGPYCGAIGYFDDRGGADLSVAIRIGVVEGGKLSVPAGGGVTLRSDPQEEYRETLAKAAPLLRILGVEAGVDG